MRRNFCPGCGKTIERGEKFCFDCRPREALEHKDISIKWCIECDKLNPENHWARFETFESGIEKTSKKAIKSKEYDIIGYEMPELERKPGIDYEGSIKIIFDEQEFDVPFIISTTTCPQCSKINDQYIEGILQLRGCSDDVKEFVLDWVKKNKDKGVNINKHEKVRGGEDFVFNNKRQMRRLAQHLKKKFPYKEYKEAAQHFSADKEGTIIYRVNILFRQ